MRANAGNLAEGVKINKRIHGNALVKYAHLRFIVEALDFLYNTIMMEKLIYSQFLLKIFSPE